MVKEGDCIRLTEKPDCYTSLEEGDEGVVAHIVDVGDDDFRQVWVDWDEDVQLMLILPKDADTFEVLDCE